MIKKILLPLILVLLIASCASAPEGFEDAKTSALSAQDRAVDMNAPEDVPSRYGEAESVLSMAQEKETAGELEEALDLYQKAEVNFNVAAAEAEKKQRLDQYMNDEVTPLVDELEQRINS